MTERVILVIEDDLSIRRGMVDALRHGSYAVREAGDGVTGSEMALTGDLDLVLLDLVMPGRDGIEVLRRIRREDPALPVIVVTARGAEDDRVRGLEPEPQIARAVKPPPTKDPPPRPTTEPTPTEDVISATSDSPLPDQQAASAELEKIPTARDPWAILQSTPGVLADRINAGGNESGQQSQYLQPDLNLQAFERRRELGRQTTYAGAKVEEIESAFEARWLGSDLVLLRRIRRGEERLLQGTVLDWPKLRGLLLERVEPVVPASRLEAVGENDEIDPGRRPPARRRESAWGWP